MLGPTPDWGSRFSAEGDSGLEPSRESRPSHNPVELYSQAGPQEVWLQNYAVTALVHLTYQHMLERLAENNWEVQPSGNLRTCLRNACHITDHAFQDRNALVKTLEKLRTVATVTSDWSPELDRGIA